MDFMDKNVCQGIGMYSLSDTVKGKPAWVGKSTCFSTVTRRSGKEVAILICSGLHAVQCVLLCINNFNN